MRDRMEHPTLRVDRGAAAKAREYGSERVEKGGECENTEMNPAPQPPLYTRAAESAPHGALSCGAQLNQQRWFVSNGEAGVC